MGICSPGDDPEAEDPPVATFTMMLSPDYKKTNQRLTPADRELMCHKMQLIHDYVVVLLIGLTLNPDQ